jgi:hypothetical protein|tara:strand:- start:13 stop:387 length:375 start_codon:yes stop_codon:yes gene_type:complete
MAVESMRFRCPDAVPIGAIYVRDWRLVFCHHATIEPAPGHVVPGCLWEISYKCEEILDTFEGFPHYYTKMWLQQDGESFMAYDMNPPLTYSAPAPSYVDSLQQGYADWDLPVDYLDEALYYDGR